MADKKKPTSISLDPSILALLAQHAGTSSRSEYIGRVVEARARQVVAALEVMRLAGWRRAELLAACDALNGYWLIGQMTGVGSSGAALGMELQDAATLNKLPAKWEVHGDRWAEIVNQLRGDRGGLAAALLVVVEEFWVGNAYVERAIERM